MEVCAVRVFLVDLFDVHICEVPLWQLVTLLVAAEFLTLWCTILLPWQNISIICRSRVPCQMATVFCVEIVT